MEIEPEVLPPEGAERGRRQGAAPGRRAPGGLSTLLFGAVALAFAAVLLFFMFWVFVAFAAVGLAVVGINALRRLLTGGKPTPSQGNVKVRFHIDRRR